MTYRPNGLNDSFTNNVNVNENCYAKKFIGDGSELTNITAPVGSVEWDAIIGDQTDVSLGGFDDDIGVASHISTSTIHFTSNALWTAINANTASCAIIAPHIDDTTNPHGTTLTQTYLNVASCAITADNTTVSMAFVRNIVFGTDATPPTASNFPQGTIYVQYTP